MPKLKTSTKLILVTIGIAIFGIVMVYSASYYSAKQSYGDAFFFARKQILGVLLGIVAMFLVSLINANFYKKFAFLFAVFGALLLVIVLIPGLSVSAYGARRWIKIPILGTIAPGEIAKFCFVIFMAFYLERIKEKNKTIKSAFLIFVVFLTYCGLIMLQPNFSTVMCLAFIMVLMLFVGGLKIREFCLLSIPAFLAVPALIIAEPYRLKRLTAFLNPWENPLSEGYQLIQSLYSLGTGGFFGVGLFNSRQKYLFLPFSESDFVFSIIGEELGLFGMILLLLAFAYMIFLIFKIGLNAKNRHQAYLCFGIACVIAVQVLVNVAVVSGSIPPTGLPLPFISAGSTSLVVFMSAIGVVLNINKQSKT